MYVGGGVPSLSSQPLYLCERLHLIRRHTHPSRCTHHLHRQSGTIVGGGGEDSVGCGCGGGDGSGSGTSGCWKGFKRDGGWVEREV